MKLTNNIYTKPAIFIFIAVMVFFSCGRDDFENLEPATYPVNGEIFIDGFSGGLDYAAFENSKLDAFDVDVEVVYEGTASMRFDVPDAGQADGGYAGGAFTTSVGRDLTSFDALTFWARSSEPANIDVIGFGNDLEESKFVVSIENVAVNSGWTKYYIPIPDPSKLTQEKGMLFYAASPENERGYSFWIDEVQFETLGTISDPRPSIFNGNDVTINAETGEIIDMEPRVTFTLPNGQNQAVNVSTAYFDFIFSDPSIATFEDGNVTVIGAGTTVVGGSLAGINATGLLTIQSSIAVVPTMIAPIPTIGADSVISLFSNVYQDVPVDVWNTYWEFSTAETVDFQVNGDDMKRYSNLNFVGIEFTTPTIDISEMTHFHIDIWTPDPTDFPAAFKVLLVDFGPNDNFDGGDDSSHELSFTKPLLLTGTWVSIDVPLSSFVGLTGRSNLAQMVLSGDVPNVFVDNVYFYKGEDGGGGGGSNPGMIVGAPIPTQSAADVLSIFSDSYTNVDGTNFYPDWGQTTTVAEQLIEGNNTLTYSGFNYQGVELASSQDVSSFSNLHIDVWTENATALNVFLISPGPIETPYAIPVPTDGWLSLDIPLTSFAPVDLSDLFQLKFDGSGALIYLDNIYFY